MLPDLGTILKHFLEVMLSDDRESLDIPMYDICAEICLRCLFTTVQIQQFKRVIVTLAPENGTTQSMTNAVDETT